MPGSVHAEDLPWAIGLQHLVSIAPATFLLECRQTKQIPLNAGGGRGNKITFNTAHPAHAPSVRHGISMARRMQIGLSDVTVTYDCDTVSVVEHKVYCLKLSSED